MYLHLLDIHMQNKGLFVFWSHSKVVPSVQPPRPIHPITKCWTNVQYVHQLHFVKHWFGCFFPNKIRRLLEGTVGL